MLDKDLKELRDVAEEDALEAAVSNYNQKKVQ